MVPFGLISFFTTYIINIVDIAIPIFVLFRFESVSGNIMHSPPPHPHPNFKRS